jgi:hypothetical protein
MTERFEINHKRIFEIACALKPIYDEQEEAFNALLFASMKVNELNAAWEASVVAYQNALLSYAEDIAKATNNSADNVRTLFCASDNMQILWTPADVLNIARYESFSRYAWKHPGASVRNEYSFPVA